MSDLIRKIGELHIAATVDYNEKVAALEAADKKYLVAFGAADQARVEARNAALAARDAAVSAAFNAYDTQVAEIQALYEAKISTLDAEIAPIQEAHEAARMTFDKAHLAWAAVVDDVALGGLDDEDDPVQLDFDEDEDDGEEADEDADGEDAGVWFWEEAKEEGEVTPSPATDVELTPPAELIVEAAQPEVTSQPEVINDPAPSNFPEVTITGTLTVGETVAEPAPAGEAGGIEPVVVESSLGEGSGDVAPAPAVIDFTPAVEPTPEPTFDFGPVVNADPTVSEAPPADPVTVDATPPAPVVEAAPETPATFPVEYADVPIDDTVVVQADAPVVIEGPFGAEIPTQEQKLV